MPRSVGRVCRAGPIVRAVGIGRLSHFGTAQRQAMEASECVCILEKVAP